MNLDDNNSTIFEYVYEGFVVIISSVIPFLWNIYKRVDNIDAPHRNFFL